MDKSILHTLTYGLYLVSVKDKDVLGGCIVNTVTQITSSNPIVAISINKDNYTNKLIRDSKRVAINILANDTTMDLIKTFGFFSSRDINKFADIDYEIIDDSPVLKDNIVGYFIGDVIDIIEVETHDIFLVRITNTNKLNDKEPLTYSYYQKNMKGTSPKNAPTYEEKEVKSTANVYRCIICGHIYDDAKEKVKFADLPDDWQCPICGVSKDKFEKIN